MSERRCRNCPYHGECYEMDCPQSSDNEEEVA